MAEEQKSEQESKTDSLIYPKIETLWNRDDSTFKVKPQEFRWPEFALPTAWHVTEKIDGTNVRILLQSIPSVDSELPSSAVSYRGRTDATQMPVVLFEALQQMLPAPKVAAAFDPDTNVVLFGEAYGPKIQKGGGLYRSGPGFRLFDVVVFGGDGRPWWLTWENVESVATKLGIHTVPVLASAASLEEACVLVSGPSQTADEDHGTGRDREGIVARTEPPLFTRSGRRLIWKLKTKDL